MSLYITLTVQESSLKCLSPQQVVLEPRVVWGKRWQGYLEPFRKWSGMGPFHSWSGTVYYTKQTYKAHTNDLGKKAQQMSIIVNGARQRWGVRFSWRIKDVRDWHLEEAHRWCTSEGKSSLGKRERVRLIHDSQRGFETHRVVETHMWGGDCWVYMSPTLNNDERNE